VASALVTGRRGLAGGRDSGAGQEGCLVSGNELSAEVHRFITERIDSAEQLEILLLLHREPERQWSAQDVSKEVYTVPASATMRLESLVSGGLISSTGGADPHYRYSPATDTLRVQVDQLSTAYRADRVAVIKTIFARPPDPLQSFADAFRLRGRPE
jgi:hypothetical protein